MDTPMAPALEALARLEEALADGVAVFTSSLWQLPEAELLPLLRRVHALDAQRQTLQLTVVRELDTRGVAAAAGATSLQAFLAAALRMTPKLAGEQAKLSESLATRHSEVGAALAQAEISYEQAKAIADIVDGLPKTATMEQKDRAREYLLAKAAQFDARDLRRMGKRIDEVIDPDGTPDREEAARSKRGAHIKDNHDGTQTLRWTDTDENMAIAKAAIGALAAPVPGEDGERDPRPPALRCADAMLDLCRRALDAGEFDPSRGVRPHLHVTFTDAAMRGEPGTYGRTDTGEHLSPAVLRRLLCDASVTGILLDGNGVPLKVGRTKRTATPGQWIALRARDGGCCFPGCTRPPMWCQAHHFPEWTNDGKTDLDCMGLFCVVHHHYLHDKGWTARLGPDGHVEVLPPPWIDPLQRPRRNWHWHHERNLAGAQADHGP